jgi:putative peptidoglycan lipid II flippase
MTSGDKRVIMAVGIVMAAMIVSRILGYLRDVVIYARFGQNRLTDVYNAAFSIPDFLYLLLVGGALSSSFIPVFAGYLANTSLLIRAI